MAKLTIRDLASVDIEVWDKTFETVPATRSVDRKVRELERELNALPDEDSDKMVEIAAKVIDLRTKPKGNARKRLGELVVEKWHAEQFTLDALLEFLTDLGDADRPT